MMDASATWNGQDPTMSTTPQDDFQQFLEMGLNDGLNFDFQDFGTQPNGQMLQQEGPEAMDTRMDVDVALLVHKEAMMQAQIPPMTTPTTQSTIAGPPIGHRHSSSNTLSEIDAQIHFLTQQRQHEERQLQEQQQQHRNNFFAHNRMVPPTPNSIEMRSANNQFYPRSDTPQQAMYENFIRMKEQEHIAFTPIASPAVTPLESHFNIPEYTSSGNYFSPLSSPAIHAQGEQRAIYDVHRRDLSAATSPNEMNMESSAGNGILAKRPPKKPTKSRGGRAIRQSPIVKARRKAGGSAVISSQTLSDIVEPVLEERSQVKTACRSIASTDGSENDSISPEHLSDMAPPPIPTSSSAGRSPFLPGQNGYARVQQISGNALSPATPASLMRLPKADQTSPALSNIGETNDQAMDDFTLPEPANPTRSKSLRVDTMSDGQTTPTIDSAVATPSFQSLPSPAFARPDLAASISSPQLSSLGASPSGAAATARKPPALASRGTKKRASVSSVQVSPALRPKISPSIKPLIRGGTTVTKDTASLLLASKSNYQNILEGTHVPGVSYPSELSTNLTSKRTSHKIAEQGRRNRINSALQEIATLLPRGCGVSGAASGSGNENGGVGTGSGSGGDAAEGGKGAGGKAGAGTGAAAAQSANSKASTVELAIEYIKQLKKEVVEANRRAEDAEKALEMKGGARPGSEGI